MMTSGFFRLLPDIPKPVWRYPISYINYGAWALQVTSLKITLLQITQKSIKALIQNKKKKTRLRGKDKQHKKFRFTCNIIPWGSGKRKNVNQPTATENEG